MSKEKPVTHLEWLVPQERDRLQQLIHYRLPELFYHRLRELHDAHPDDHRPSCLWLTVQKDEPWGSIEYESLRALPTTKDMLNYAALEQMVEGMCQEIYRKVVEDALSVAFPDSEFHAL